MSRESPTLKKGDMIVIENTRNLKKPINEFHKKWEVTKMKISFGAVATPTGVAMAQSVSMATAMKTGKETGMATEKQTGKKVTIKYYGTDWKDFENNRLIGIVTEITEEEHIDFDVIKIREQTGGVRYCRRYILENV